MDMSRRKFVEFCGLGVLSVAGTSVLAGCDGGKKGDDSGKENSAGGAVANKDKPLSSSTVSLPTAQPVSLI